MTHRKVNKTASIVLIGTTYNVYLPTEPKPTPHERRHCIWLEHFKMGNSVLTNDIRYGTFYCFSKVMLAISRVCTAVYIPKPRVDIYRTHPRKQWEALSDYDLGVQRLRAQGQYVMAINMEKWYGF